MDMAARTGGILDEILVVLGGLDQAGFDRAVAGLTRAERVFVAGAGRSGLVMRMLALRLIQAGLTVHAAGDATTPAIGGGDLLVIGSGSGETDSMRTLAAVAREAGAEVLLLTHAPDSPLGKRADLILLLPVPHDQSRPGGLAGTQLLGTLFEQCLLLTADLLAAEVCARVGAAAADLQRRHANLE